MFATVVPWVSLAPRVEKHQAHSLRFEVLLLGMRGAPNGCMVDLRETLTRISNVLEATPEQHDTFEKWALLKLKLLVNAEKEGRRYLLSQATDLRQEYLELQADVTTGIAVTGRTELVRAARIEWLAAVLDFVDGLLEARAA